jgi:hypothetical protein
MTSRDLRWVLAFVAAAFAGSWIAEWAPSWVAGKILPAFAIALVFGPSLLYPVLRLRGASSRAAIPAGLLLATVWTALECYRTAQVFSIGEGLYYALNPLMQGFATVLALQIALWEIAVRSIRRSPRALRGWPVGVLATVAAFWTAVGIANYGRDVTAIHYAYIEGYRRLFGN